MLLAFTLSMPGCASWDGKWSGSDKRYVIVREGSCCLRGHHSYSFGDGWRACVSVREIDRAEARRLRRTSNGFCGYDWMVQSLLDHGRIQTDD